MYHLVRHWVPIGLSRKIYNLLEKAKVKLNLVCPERINYGIAVQCWAVKISTKTLHWLRLRLNLCHQEPSFSRYRPKRRPLENDVSWWHLTRSASFVSVYSEADNHSFRGLTLGTDHGRFDKIPSDLQSRL